jgi:hypothetical protein
VKMGRLPSLVITETMLPDGLHEETQIARRIRHHMVYGEKKDWVKTIGAAGLSNLNLIRSVSDSVADACNAILSSVVDDCFALPATWDAIADSLGVRSIDDSPEFEDRTRFLLEFYRLVCAAPALTGREEKNTGSGYKKIERATNTPGEEESDLASVYSQFATPRNWGNARKLIEKDWSKILGVSDFVHLDIKGDDATIYCRFRVGPANRPIKLNGDIK